MRHHVIVRIVAVASLLMSAGFAPSNDRWTPQPWLDDLVEARHAIETRYANLAWQIEHRESDPAQWFDRAAENLKTASSDAEARAVFDRLIRSFGDAHVAIVWPGTDTASPTPAISTPEQFCRAQGYGVGRADRGVAEHLSDYRAIKDGDLFPAGLLTRGSHTLGVVRIGVFQPQASPSLCLVAVRALAIPIDEPCDDDCRRRLDDRVYSDFTTAFADRLVGLKAAGATVIMIDITDNGGGSEWNEAAARMLTPRTIVSARVGFVRGAHWTKHWRELAEGLPDFASDVSEEDRRLLADWSAQAGAARLEAERRCPVSGGCPWLGQAGFATGLVGSARSGSFDGKPWGPFVFSPSKYDYRDGVWDGPLIVLTDQQTWSAAEEFVALLQDNRVALVVGSRTGGAGCGYTNGGTPLTLTNSKALLEMPDCVRLRADGSNEVTGVIPDHLIGWSDRDGLAFRARLLDAALPEAIERSTALLRTLD